MAWLSKLAFGVLVAAILWRAGHDPMSPLPQLLAAVTISVMFAHAAFTLGFLNALGFAGIVMAVTFAIENLGVATGFPFGHYHFVVGANLPHVGHIPAIVGPLYFGVGWGAYVIAILLAGFSGRHSRWTVPLVAALAITCWDFSMDSVNSTIEGLWVWHDGGRYFGVPMSNFLAWFGEMLIAFSMGHGFLRHQGVKMDFSDRAVWLAPLILYASAGLSQIAPWLIEKDHHVTDLSGVVWSALAIREAAVVVAVLVMLPLAGSAGLRLYRLSR